MYWYSVRALHGVGFGCTEVALEVLRASILLTAGEKSSGDMYAACGFAVAVTDAGIARAMTARVGNCREASKPPDLGGPQFRTGRAVDAA